MLIFLLKKNLLAFAFAKLLTFVQQNTCELDILLTRINILTINEFVVLTML